ncbi:uncharacterized protein LOC114759297 [Neltuma alba]|uniref:uncharacterized protein LOC114759297 n=1 Tax=Neltuma alba TaxID=207710 RepID=UPI0010A398F2|nr:uncharacterized protein LOC114759297 [Prosopis alba]
MDKFINSLSDSLFPPWTFRNSFGLSSLSADLDEVDMHGTLECYIFHVVAGIAFALATIWFALLAKGLVGEMNNGQHHSSELKTIYTGIFVLLIIIATLCGFAVVGLSISFIFILTISLKNRGDGGSSDEDNEFTAEEDDDTFCEEDNMSLDNMDALILTDDEDAGSLSSNRKTDSLKSIDESDLDLEEGVVTSGCKKYNPDEMCKDYIFELGMEFTSITQFREAVREYSLLNGYETIYIKNDSVRCRIKCVRCDWLIFVSKERDSMTYRLKTYNPRHTCGVTFSSKNVSSKWVSEKIKNRIKTNKNMSLGDVISTIKEDYMAVVSMPKAYWAQRKAKQAIEGDFVDEYKRLWDYNNEVLSKSPETTFKILTDRPFIDRAPRFKRLYLCLDAVKIGFLAACRPIIGLDGCFLKGPYGGILLVAVGRDPNEQYFPLAIAIVEGENRDSWSWFLEHILNDIGRTQRWVFIFDQQKGLMPTFESLLPEVEHRLCVRHLYANIKSRY